jgi:hypothetical protein
VGKIDYWRRRSRRRRIGGGGGNGMTILVKDWASNFFFTHTIPCIISPHTHCTQSWLFFSCIFIVVTQVNHNKYLNPNPISAIIVLQEGVKFNDGKWHTVSARRLDKRGMVRVDGNHCKYSAILHSHTLLSASLYPP